MKAEKDWGAKRNRASHVFAHARLLSLIRYKAEAHGIAVVTAEESYTSKTSFVDRRRAEGLFQEGEEIHQDNETTQDDGTTAEQVAPAAVGYSGRRSTSNRNWFIRHNASGGKLCPCECRRERRFQHHPQGLLDVPLPCRTEPEVLRQAHQSEARSGRPLFARIEANSVPESRESGLALKARFPKGKCETSHSSR